jgi:hypothetical protein
LRQEKFMKTTTLLLLTATATLLVAQGPGDNYIMKNGQSCPRDGKAHKPDVVVLNHGRR